VVTELYGDVNSLISHVDEHTRLVLVLVGDLNSVFEPKILDDIRLHLRGHHCLWVHTFPLEDVVGWSDVEGKTINLVGAGVVVC